MNLNYVVITVKSDEVKMTLVLILLLPAALGLIGGACIYYYLSYNFTYWRKRGVVGPKPQLLVGTFPKSSAGQLNIIEELHEIYLRYRSKCRFVGVFTGREPKLFILDPILANKVLTTHFKHFHDNESSRWTTPRVEQLRLCSPIVSIGDHWRQQRAELTPALAVNKLRAHHESLQHSAKQLVKFITSMRKKQPTMNAKELANRFTVHFVGQFIWNTEVNSLNEESASRMSPVHEMADDMVNQAMRCVSYYARTASWPFLRFFRPVPFFTAASERFFTKLAKDAFELRSHDTHAIRSDVISHLMQLKEKKALNITQITGHTTTILIDGYESGALLIAHTLLMLARNESAQEKLRRELQQAGRMADYDYDAFNDFPYLEQCLQETLRLLPPLPTLFKICTQDLAIPLNDDHDKSDGAIDQLQLRKGDTVYISSYSFHHDEAFYEQPQEFRPERFDPEVGGIRKYRDEGVFLPFGAGPRMCPGIKLGLTEAKYAVAAVVSHFRLSCSSTTRADNKLAPASFLLTIDGGIDLKFDEI